MADDRDKLDPRYGAAQQGAYRIIGSLAQGARDAPQTMSNLVEEAKRPTPLYADRPQLTPGYFAPPAGSPPPFGHQTIERGLNAAREFVSPVTNAVAAEVERTRNAPFFPPGMISERAPSVVPSAAAAPAPRATQPPPPAAAQPTPTLWGGEVNARPNAPGPIVRAANVSTPNNRTAQLASKRAAAANPIEASPQINTPEAVAARAYLAESPVQAMIFGPSSQGGYNQTTQANGVQTVQPMGSEQTPEQQAWQMAQGIAGATAGRQPVRVIEGYGPVAETTRDPKTGQIIHNKPMRSGGINEGMDVPVAGGGYITVPDAVYSGGRTGEYIQALAKGAENAADPVGAKLAADLAVAQEHSRGQIGAAGQHAYGAIEGARLHGVATIEAANSKAEQQGIFHVNEDVPNDPKFPELGTHKEVRWYRRTGTDVVQIPAPQMAGAPQTGQRTWPEFLKAAKAVNPGLSEAAIRAEYDKRYGGK